MFYDVIIIGSGVTGAFTARVLSRYQLAVCMVERESDIAMGTSKANSAVVHAGYDAEPGTLKARLNVAGSNMMEQVCSQLNVHYKRTGSFVLAFEENEIGKLTALMERGIENGVKGLSVITGEQARELEPGISGEVKYVLWAQTAGIVCPYELAIAAVENAVENGMELKLEREVKSIVFENERFKVYTGKEELTSRYIVNAAGLYADSVAAMIGDRSISIRPRKGEYVLLDKNQGGIVKRVIFQLPSKMGKGVLVTPTVDGNLLIGPNAEDIDAKYDTSTTSKGIEQVIREARKSVPGFNMREVITSFAGLRASPSRGDFIIEASGQNGKFINAAGIESPGLTAAPAIGEYVADILKSRGLELKEKADYNPQRKAVIRFRELPQDVLNEIIKENPSYGRIVCRCEKVSEGEIIDCIKRPAGARNIDAVKRRTRSGMGRCQGGFCTPRLVHILSRELGIPMEEVTKSGGESRLLVGKTK